MVMEDPLSLFWLERNADGRLVILVTAATVLKRVHEHRDIKVVHSVVIVRHHERQVAMLSHNLLQRLNDFRCHSFHECSPPGYSLALLGFAVYLYPKQT